MPSAAAAVPPGDEPGLTMRAFQLGQPISELCTLKSGQTPNVDLLKPTIDWDAPADFGGLQDNFVVEALANLSVETTGAYQFRMTSDDGSRLTIDSTEVIDHDGLHGDTAKTGTTTLTAGTVHKLRIDYFEAGGGERLLLEWMPPGASTFSVVPTSVLSTEANVTRVTAPGFKQCEGQNDSEGDGLQLGSVNPAYDLVNLRPNGFEPQVTGLEWDGSDLLVLTWGGNGNDQGNVELGELYRLSGVQGADSPADVTHTRIASGLKEPQGISVVDGEIYVSEKTGLIKLTQKNAQGVYEGSVEIAKYPFDGNFHEFGFGMLYKDGKFHVNLSVSINLGGATTVPQGSHDRGTHITIDKATGAIDYVAGGLRTPHGMGWGPAGEIFVTDNQGGWLPASKLIEIKRGEFYNHFTTEPDGTPGRFDDQPVTKPVLWMPQNEIANSPSTPVVVDAGPYAGQMFIGDVTYGGLQRADLEKVDGRYQGALFRMTQGLEAGVSRVLKAPNGSLVIGGLGAGGNWGQTGKLRYGLQKLDLSGKTPFDMKSMDVVEGGFEIEYTQPLAPATLQDLASKYQLKQWRYRATAQYGGPKLDEESLAVTSATASEDGRTVTLQVDGMKPDRVVHLRSPRPFQSATGETLWSTEAWYTLNSYPGYVEAEPEPAPDGIYELEDGELSGTAGIDTEHAGYTGSGFVDGIQTVGSGSAVTVVAPRAGSYDLQIRYANGPNPQPNQTKKMSLYIGDERRQISLPPFADWKTWGTFTTRVTLPAGATRVEIAYETGDDGHVNLDHVKLVDPTGGRVEAEAGTITGDRNRVQTEHAGYSGTGYVGGFEVDGASVTFDVTATAAGYHNVKLGYANGPNPQPNQTKVMSVYVNGVFAKKLSLPPFATWKEWGSVTDQLELRAGANVVKIQRDAGDNGNVNIDYLDLGAREACAPGQVPSADDEFDGTTLDTCRWSTILNKTSTGVAVAGGQLRINAQAGDLSGGAVDAKNMVLQNAPAEGPWAATTQLTMTGTDDYLQGGLVAWTSATNYAKFVAMEKPDGDWVLELGRRINGDMVYTNADLPDGAAPDDLQLQMVSTGTAIQGRWSVDQGATWQSMGAGYPSTGLVAPKIGVAAYNGTGSQVGAFDWFRVSDEVVVEPDACEATTADPGYRTLFDGTAESLEDWNMAGPGVFTREADCTLKTNGGLGLLWHSEPLEGDYSLQLDWKLVKDDNGGVFVGFPNPGTDPWVAVNQGYEIQIDATDDPDSTTGAIYNFQSADLTARDAALKPVGQWNHYEIKVEGKRIRIYLNDVLVNDFTSTDENRLKWPSYIGLQNHGGGESVFYRDVQVKELADPENVPATVTVTAPEQLQTGKKAQVEVAVTSAAQETPTGEVVLSVDGTDLPAATLKDGKATFEVGPFAAGRTVELVAKYAGDVAHDAGQGKAQVKVVTPAPVPTPPTNPPADAPSVKVKGEKADATPNRRKAKLTVRCGTVGCEGKAVLRTRGKDGKRLGAGTFDLDSREKDKVTLKLTKRARALLGKKATVKAVLVVRFEDGGTQRVSVRLTR
ncbi:family 16 glycoside hydrolase [Nocardioides xinjiangensis]|uniref:family 16 glycoside hydrolase n=1 Tax=Nocardioides xinjiangensis TaxID=2817376 RepID=UPI001FEDD95C|nr:family 16 glycoside hydrolase [Nocardioides sp. SYSU D00514]